MKKREIVVLSGEEMDEMVRKDRARLLKELREKGNPISFEGVRGAKILHDPLMDDDDWGDDE